MENTITPFMFEQAFDAPSQGESIIEGLLDERDQAKQLVDEILQRLDQLNHLKTRFCPVRGKCYESLADDLMRNISGYSENFLQYKSNIIKKIDARYWLSVLESTKLTAIMNAKNKDRLKSQINDQSPEFCRTMVYATLEHYLGCRFKTFSEGVIELFQSLDDNFVSNDKIAFRKKIILKQALGPHGWSFYTTGKDQIDDLENFFLLIDGKDPSEKIFQNSATHLIEQASNGLGQFEITLPYFTVNGFCNGNLHINFTQKKLVNRLNQVIARHLGDSLGHRKAKR